MRIDRLTPDRPRAKAPRRAPSSHRLAALSRLHPSYDYRARGHRRWMSATDSVALVLIAVAALVGAGFTAWHYWNEEGRIGLHQQHTMVRRAAESWNRQIREAHANRQQLRELHQAIAQVRSSPRPALLAEAPVAENASPLEPSRAMSLPRETASISLASMSHR